MPLSYFKTATFALRQRYSHKERLICWSHYYSNQLHVPRYGPAVHPATGPAWSRTVYSGCLDSVVLLWFVLLSVEGVTRQMWDKSPCHEKGTIVLRGKLSWSVIIWSSARCSSEWGLIGKNPVETSTGAERLGEERDRTGAGQGRNRRCQICKRLLQRGRE